MNDDTSSRYQRGPLQGQRGTHADSRQLATVQARVLQRWKCQKPLASEALTLKGLARRFRVAASNKA